MLSLPLWSGVDSPGAEVPCAPSLFPSPPTRRKFGEEGAQACLPFDSQPIFRLTAAARAVHGSCLGKEACHQSSQLRGCRPSTSYALRPFALPLSWGCQLLAHSLSTQWRDRPALQRNLPRSTGSVSGKPTHFLTKQFSTSVLQFK